MAMAANSTDNSSVCNSGIKTTKHTFVWNIDHFSAQNRETGECFESGIFISSSPSGNPLKWKLRFYPNGRHKETEDHAAIYIVLVDPSANEVLAKQSYWIRDSKGGNAIQFDTPNNKFSGNQPGFGFTRFIKGAELRRVRNGYLPNDRLTIICEITVYGEETVECSQNAVVKFQIPECRTSKEISDLFDKSLFTDYVLVASLDAKEFKVHKCILAARSPVFAAMFQHQMTESQKGVAKIEDIESPVLEQMLIFIYSGTAPKLAEMPEELLESADKYQLDRLKVLCEHRLAKSIEVENACKLLALADRHSAKNLKDHAIEFIKKRPNEVVESDGWKELKANHGDLIRTGSSHKWTLSGANKGVS